MAQPSLFLLAFLDVNKEALNPPHWFSTYLDTNEEGHPQKQAVYARFRRWLFLTDPTTLHPRKRAHTARFRGWLFLANTTVNSPLENKPRVLGGCLPMPPPPLENEPHMLVFGGGCM